jgi:hypothetical protein
MRVDHLPAFFCRQRAAPASPALIAKRVVSMLLYKTSQITRTLVATALVAGATHCLCVVRCGATNAPRCRAAMPAGCLRFACEAVSHHHRP